MFTTYESLALDILSDSMKGLGKEFYAFSENKEIILMPKAKEVLDKCKEKVSKLSEER